MTKGIYIIITLVLLYTKAMGQCSISGDTTVCAGSRDTLHASAVCATGGTWSSSDTAVATVNSSGIVFGASTLTTESYTTIEYSAGTGHSFFTVGVKPLPNAGTITGATVMCAGSTHHISLSDAVFGGAWSSSNTAVATVTSSTGNVFGVSPGGTDTIYYTVINSCGSAVAAHIIMVQIPLTTYPLIDGLGSGWTHQICALHDTLTGYPSGGTWAISAGFSITTITSSTASASAMSAGGAIITYTISNACNSLATTTTDSFYAHADMVMGHSHICTGVASVFMEMGGGGTWSSSNPAVATVYDSLVTGVSAGTAVISYSVPASYCFSASVTSLSITVGGPGVISPNTDSVCMGNNITLSETYYGGTWSPISGGTHADVSSAGVITTISPGTQLVTYTCGGSTATDMIKIKAVPAVDTVAGPSTICTGTYSYFDSSIGGTWSAGGSGVSITTGGVLTAVTGTHTGVAGWFGSANYTIASGGCSTTATLSLNIYATPVAGGIVPFDTSMCIGAIKTMSDTGGTTGGIWRSSNTAIATIDSATGHLTALSAGTATISYIVTTAFCGAATAVTTLTVLPTPTAGTITVPSAVCVGYTVDLTQSGTGGGTWTSGNTTKAIVDALTGVVTGEAAGVDTIYYSMSNACGSMFTSATVTVNALPSALPPSESVCAGASSFTLSSLPSGGSWSSSAPGVASVSSSGVVTSVSAGLAYISYTLSTGCYVDVPVTVHALPVIATAPFPLMQCGSLTLHASGAITYSWLPTTGLVPPPTGPTVTCTVTATTTYTITGTDAYGCVGVGYQEVMIPGCSNTCSAMGSATFYGLGGPVGTTGTITTMPAGNYYVYSDVTISGKVIFAGNVLPILSGTRILVTPGGELDIDSSHLYCCSNSAIWKGILLQSDSATANSGKMSIGYNSLIEDADTAVKIVKGVMPLSGLLFKSDGAVFNRNNIGVDIEQFPASYSSVPPTPSVYPFYIRNSVFTSRDMSLFANTSYSYPLAWPIPYGNSTALKAPYTPALPTMPPLNITSPTGEGYGNRYKPDTCKNGKPANVGIQLLNVGAYSTTGINGPATFSEIVIGDSINSGVAYMNLFDTLLAGIYGKFSNFASFNNTFLYMYNAPTGFSVPNFTGCGIGAEAPPAPSTVTGYPLYGMRVTGSFDTSGSFGTNNWFYDCGTQVKVTGYYYVTGHNSEMFSNHTTSYLTGNWGYFVQSPRYYSVSVTDNIITNNLVGISMNSIALAGAAGGLVNQFSGNINLSGNTIQGWYGGTPPSMGFVNMGIIATNAYSGASTGGYSSLPIVRIDTNNMYYVNNGISVSGYQNQIVLTDTNFISLFWDNKTLTAPRYGIEHNNCKLNTIYNNQIVGPGATSPSFPASTYLTANKFVGIFGNGNIQATVNCNFVDSLNTGFQFYGAGNITAWRNNVMKDNSYGMALQGHFGNQGSRSVISYNEWRGTWSGTRYNIFTLVDSIPRDTIYVTNNFGPYLFDPLNNNGLPVGSVPVEYGYGTTGIGNGLVIDTVVNPTPPACVEIYENPGWYPLLDITQPNYNMGQVAKSLNWISQNNLYRLLISDSSYSDSSTTLAQFQYMGASSRYKWLSDIENAIVNGNESTSASLLSVGIDTYIDTAFDSATGVKLADDTAVDYIVNNYITLYSEYRLYEDSSMSGNDSSIVLGIANLCPYLNGNVVFQARALYRILYSDDTTVFSDTCTIDTTGLGDRHIIQGGINSKPTIQTYNLFPNPNDATFTIRQLISDNASVMITVQDVLGKKLYQQNVQFNNNIMQIQVGKIPPGVYLLQISDEKNISNFKFIVN